MASMESVSFIWFSLLDEVEFSLCAVRTLGLTIKKKEILRVELIFWRSYSIPVHLEVQKERNDFMSKKEEKKSKFKEKRKSLWNDFKAFINRGNVFNLAVGVVIGGAFNAIVTAFTNILISICTWGVPGGIKGLVTVLPAANEIQAGVDGIGQSFTDLTKATIAYAASQGVTITPEDASFVQWQNSLKSLYTLHGKTWTYNLSAVIDWGTFINAVISFLIIALTLFVIVKVVTSLNNKRLQFEADAREAYYQKHPEERPVPVAPDAPKPTQEELLTAILAELKKQNGEAEKKAE